MIHVTTRLKVSPGKLDAVISSIRGLIEPTRTRNGCLRFDLLQEVSDVGHLVIEERWLSQENFEKHICSAAYRTILESIEFATEPPIVEIHEVSSSQGMEAVRRILDSAQTKGG